MELPEFDCEFLSRRRAIMQSTASTTANIKHKPVIETAMAKLLCDMQMSSPSL
jgi:hypothetical protein